MIKISDHPFSKAGSLVPTTAGDINVSAIASNRFVILDKYGPFNNCSDYFTRIAEQYLDLIADGQVYYKYPKESFLFYHILLKHVPAICSNEPQPGTFFLKHVDDKGDHIMIDEDYNITGIIDWQFARLVPGCEAFGPSLLMADMGSLYSGASGITAEDLTLSQSFRAKGREDLAKYACVNDMARKFNFGLTSGLTKSEVNDMVSGLHTLLGITDLDVQAWIADEMAACQSDHRWADVEALDDENPS